MKNLKLLSIVFGFASLVIVGCKKGDKGATGPAGPTNVLHSAWISLNTPLDPSDSLYKEAISASGLTSAILDSGLVLSYVGFPGNGTNGTDTAVLSISEASTLYGVISQELYVGEIDLYSLYDYTNVLYRYVLIPGTILTNGIGGTVYTKQQLKAMTYSDLQKKLAQTASTSATN